MGSKIMFCEKCRRYTMRSICCNLQTKSPKPARFRLKDEYVKYRIKGRSANV